MLEALMMIHWNIFKLQSGHGLFWQFWIIQWPLLQSALWDLVGCRTWPRYFANKHFHKVWWLYNENYWSYWADKCSGHRPCARRTFFHKNSRFFKWAYKKGCIFSARQTLQNIKLFPSKYALKWPKMQLRRYRKIFPRGHAPKPL